MEEINMDIPEEEPIVPFLPPEEPEPEEPELVVVENPPPEPPQ